MVVGNRSIPPLKDLILLERLAQAGAKHRCLTSDWPNPAGRMLMQMVGSFAEFERAMIRERTQAGLAVARAEGRIGGRRPKLGSQQQAAIVDLVTSGRQTRRRSALISCIRRRWSSPGDATAD